MSATFPTALIILDGVGVSCEKKYNAWYQAKTPHLDQWQKQYFYTTLYADGNFVGLAEGYYGNSEVGHFTLGAGRIITQSSTLLHEALHPNNLCKNSTLTNFLKNFNPNNTIHLLGLASDGNIHSNLSHLRNLIYTLASHNNTRVLVHAFLDGRDVALQSALQYLDLIQSDLTTLSSGSIASIHGRYYAMDRNNNDDRTEKSFNVMTQQQPTWQSYQTLLAKSYAQGIFDEHIIPAACIEDHTIKPGDGIIFFNFRPDRAIQLTKKLLTCDVDFFVTPITYHKTLPTTPLIKAVQAEQTLLEILSANQKSIMTIAETEKYAHVTYFFNGHKDITFENEQRVLIPSDKDKEPADAPNMQAEKITQTVLASLQNNPKDFYLINYANADMVGHSGNLPATIQAMDCIDTQLGMLYDEIVLQQNGVMYVTADHGNAECMFDETSQQPCTSHTNNPVPFYILTKRNYTQTNLISLADVAPCIIKNMHTMQEQA